MTKEVAEMNSSMGVATSVQTIDMPGLEDMPTSWIPVPRIKLVQPNSQETLLQDGTEARKGSFFYENLKTAEDALKVAILAAKPLSYTGPSMDDPSKIETKHSIGIVFYDLNMNKVYTMRFQPGSFQSWRSLIGQTLAAREAGDMTTFFSRAINITSERVSEGSRTWYALRFGIGERLDEVTFDTAATLFEQYQAYFRTATQSEDAE